MKKFIAAAFLFGTIAGSGVAHALPLQPVFSAVWQVILPAE